MPEFAGGLAAPGVATGRAGGLPVIVVGDAGVVLELLADGFGVGVPDGLTVGFGVAVGDAVATGVFAAVTGSSSLVSVTGADSAALP